MRFSLLLGGFVLLALPSSVMADQVSREQDIVNLRLGQRVKVDDGTCPAGQIKEVSGTKMTSTGDCPLEQVHSAAGPQAEIRIQRR